MSTTASSDLAKVDYSTLEKVALDALDDGKSVVEALEELFRQVGADSQVEPQAVQVPAITPEQKSALRKIVDLYGSVVPSEPRLLTEDELVRLGEERHVIDTVLGFLKPRKDESIRESIANHFDKVAERDGLVDEDTPKDKHGHYAVKQTEKVPGHEWQRIPSGGKPKLTDRAVFEAYERGDLTRDEYLSITTKPEVERVIDTVKARKAFKAHPDLMRKLAALMERQTPITTIKMVSK